MAQATRAPKKCQDCPTVFQPQPRGAVPIRCPDCRLAAVKRWKAEGYARRSPAGFERPCKALCGRMVQRNGKVYPSYCRDACKPHCTVEECEQPQRKNMWCAAHYSMWKRVGVVRPFGYKWSNKRDACLSCGESFEVTHYRKFCNGACRAYWFAHGGELPSRAVCVQCFKEIPVGKVEGRTRRQRFDIKMCRRCRQDMRKYGISAEELFNRDGAACGLCSTDVDMSLRAPDPGCPSVDHKIPRSKGGSNEPGNLQLAHLRCNILKHDKLYAEYIK